MSVAAAEPEKRDVKNPLLFECAWEVANKGWNIRSNLQPTPLLKISINF